MSSAVTPPSSVSPSHSLLDGGYNSSYFGKFLRMLPPQTDGVISSVFHQSTYRRGHHSRFCGRHFESHGPRSHANPRPLVGGVPVFAGPPCTPPRR